MGSIREGLTKLTFSFPHRDISAVEAPGFRHGGKVLAILIAACKNPTSMG